MNTAGLTRFYINQTRSFRTSVTLSALTASVRARAEQISNQWKGTNATGGTTKNFISGEFVDSRTQEWYDVVDPVSRH